MEAQWNQLENKPEFVKWVGDVIDGSRYAIVWATTGTGLKWVKFTPPYGDWTTQRYSTSERYVYSHGNFYGESVDEAIATCEWAVKQIICRTTQCQTCKTTEFIDKKESVVDKTGIPMVWCCKECMNKWWGAEDA